LRFACARARNAIREAAAWYRERDEALAERFLAAVERALRHLEEFPPSGS
jgi:hypothetical protein